MHIWWWWWWWSLYWFFWVEQFFELFSKNRIICRTPQTWFDFERVVRLFFSCFVAYQVEGWAGFPYSPLYTIYIIFVLQVLIPTMGTYNFLCSHNKVVAKGFIKIEKLLFLIIDFDRHLLLIMHCTDSSSIR